MESFFLNGGGKTPVQSLTIAEGETKVLRLRKPKAGEPDVSVYCRDTKVAEADRVRGLKDPSKHSLNADIVHPDGYYAHRIPLADVTKGDDFFVQVTGLSVGQTELAARSNTLDHRPYAAAVPVKVTANPKSLLLGVPFSTLWSNHPYSRRIEFVCDASKNNQCMMRFCDTLVQSKVSLKGLVSKNRCGKAGVAGHAHHFSNPYDFEGWKGLKTAHVWKAAPPFQAEPMPGVAALNFIRNRWKGVVVLYHYFDRGVPEGKVVTKGDMYGGHIDLWDGTRMGNDLLYGTMADGGFYRSSKIAFWPMERCT